MSSCLNCHQPVMPGDEICENCGAVLSSVLATTPAAFVVAPASVSLPVPLSGLSICPTCTSPIQPGDEICEQCGMVLSSTTGPVGQMITAQPHTTGSAPVLTQCPTCHGPRKPGSKFCNRCGTRYDSVIATSTATSSTQPITPAAAQRLKIGDFLHDKYKISKEIGEGGMGAVYLADDQVLKRQVVIKALLSDDDPDIAAQSVKEREFLAAIKHASIVSIYDFLTIGTQGYIVMEYVHGKTLDQIMEDQGRPFAVQEAITHILGILPAFTYLARLGLVYCDFKPQNVMLEVLKDGSQAVKLIDLGTVIKHEPRPTDVYGTHGFYAPEAVKHPSPETDLYTLCRTLAYLVTQMDLANPLFGMPSSEHYKAFRDYPALYRLLVKGTHKEAPRRFHSAEQLADQLAGVLRQIQGGRPGELVGSKQFVPGILTTTGKLGLRGEAMLEERDKAIDLLHIGDQALRSGNYVSAQHFYTQACRTNRQSLDAHLRLAEVLIEQGDFPQALAEVTQAQKLQPGSWKIAWYTGRLLEAQGKLRAAADQYNDLIADLPGELPPLQALARTYAKLGDSLQAVRLYTAVLKAEPGNTEAVLGATDALLHQQNWDEATKLLKSVNEAAARFVDAQLLLCKVYLQYIHPLSAQTIEQAAQVIEVLNSKTEDPRYYLARGDVYHAAWQLAHKQGWPRGTALAGVADTSPKTLGAAAEESYKRYLHIGKPAPTERETLLRKKFAVAPWRLL